MHLVPCAGNAMHQARTFCKKALAGQAAPQRPSACDLAHSKALPGLQFLCRQQGTLLLIKELLAQAAQALEAIFAKIPGRCGSSSASVAAKPSDPPKNALARNAHCSQGAH